MSDDSSDELFASADEGSDDEMSPSVKPINNKPVKNSSIAKPKPSDISDPWEDKSSPSTFSPANLYPSNQKKTSIERPLPDSKDGDGLIDIVKPMIRFEDTPENQLTNNKSVTLIEEDSWDIEDDPWSNPRESNEASTSIPHLKSRKVITGMIPEQKKDLTSNDAWSPEDEIGLDVASQQTEDASKVLATQPHSMKFERLDELNRHNITNESSIFTCDSVDQASIKTTEPTVPENLVTSGNTGAWDVEDNFCVEFVDEPSREVEKDSDLPQNKQLQKVGESSTEEVKASGRQFKSQPKLVKEDLSKWVSTEEENVWDLVDDPWVELQSKEGEKLNSWDLKNDSCSKTKAMKEGSNTEGNVDNMGDLHAKLSALAGSPSSASQELASAASALVKSVGGGLASFVGGIKFPNLSSFEESRAPELPPDCETNDQTVGDNGWSAWNLGSIAKSLTSAVENTGMQLITGSVDVLEQIGRKTFTALKENDPGLVYTKRFLRPVDPNSTDGPKLSQILRDASDQQQHTQDSGSVMARRGDLAFQLESRLALVHMEALELLSSRASARLTTKLARLESTIQDDADISSSLISEGGVLERIWETLQVKKADSEVLEQDSGSEHPVTSLSDAVRELDQIVPGNVLIKICDELLNKSKELKPDLPMKEIFCQSIEALAELTSAVLGYLHKLAECLILIGHQQQHRDQLNGGFLNVAEKVASIIALAKRQNEVLCSIYVEHLKETLANNGSKEEDGESEDALVSGRRLVANLFLDTGMANGYLDDAATNHLVPVLQVACLDAFTHEASPTRETGRPTKSKLR
nr:protein FAM114A2 [Hymenolepis microstoma]